MKMRLYVKGPIAATCHYHPDCVIYWLPDRARNRLRGRAIHVAATTLYNGRINDERYNFSWSGWEKNAAYVAPVGTPPGTKSWRKLGDLIGGPIFWNKEELRRKDR